MSLVRRVDNLLSGYKYLKFVEEANEDFGSTDITVLSRSKNVILKFKGRKSSILLKDKLSIVPSSDLALVESAINVHKERMNCS